MEKVVETFRTHSKNTDGLISYDELCTLLQTVDPAITEDNFQVMMAETGARGGDKMKFDEFAAWLGGEQGPPAVVKATDDEDAEEDDEQSIMDEDDVKNLAAELELEGVDIDLTQRVNKKLWMAINRELAIDPAEAGELFDDIAEEAAQDGFLNPEEGYPLVECLDELKVEADDIESMRAIAKAVERAKEKLQKPPEDLPPPDNPQVLNPALDKVVRELDQAERSAEDAWDIVREGLVPLSKAQKAALDTFAERREELVAKVKEFMVLPPLVNAAAGQNACRQLCTEAVNKIIEECKAQGKKFTDPTWDVEKNPSSILYVDKKNPGYDCTVGQPAGYKRITELVKDPVLFKDGIKPGDIIQGQIGTCYLLGAMGAVVSKDAKCIRKLFIKHDIEAGVYAVRFCLDGEWTYVIVDDVMPVDKNGRLLYASSKDPQEVWCPILEKAYCKLHTCYEMCDGGFSTEAIFNFFGGVSGKLNISESHVKDPSSYFKLLKQAKKHGWLLTTHFSPKKGAMAGAGKCGEAAFDSGLYGGHCYSVLKVVEACGNQLVCCRNPWGRLEWKGKWSDKNLQGEWTEEMKEATGYRGLEDGRFWMSVEDFVHNAGDVNYARTFGPDWQKISQYKRFRKVAMVATAKRDREGGSKVELPIKKGEQLEVVRFHQRDWWFGKNGDGQEGYFPSRDVRLNDRPVARFDMVGQKADGANHMTVVVLLMQPDSTRLRKYFKHKTGKNYKDTRYPCIQLCIVDPQGNVFAKKQSRKREVWHEMQIPGGEGWKIYVYSVSGTGSQFVLRTYVKDGSLALKEVPDVDVSELQAVIFKS